MKVRHKKYQNCVRKTFGELYDWNLFWYKSRMYVKYKNMAILTTRPGWDGRTGWRTTSVKIKLNDDVLVWKVGK